jgi:hypothetical protein
MRTTVIVPRLKGRLRWRRLCRLFARAWMAVRVHLDQLPRTDGVRAFAVRDGQNPCASHPIQRTPIALTPSDFAVVTLFFVSAK